MEAITLHESQILTRLETIIQSGKQAFVEVGDALTQIRDGRLYRSDFKSFEDYCQEKWGFTKRRANQIIEAAETVNELPEKIKPLVTNERIARAVAKLPEHERVAAIERASENGIATSASVAAAKVGTMVPTSAKPEESRDETGHVVPARLLPLWARNREGRDMMQTISGWRRFLKQVREAQDPLWRHVSPATMEEAMATLFQQFRSAIPYAVCPACHGLDRPKCGQCKGAGFLSEHIWTMTVPQEVKELRELAEQVRKAKL